MPWYAKLKQHPNEIEMRYGQPAYDAFVIGKDYPVKNQSADGEQDEVRVFSDHIWYYFTKRECKILFEKPYWR